MTPTPEKPRKPDESEPFRLEPEESSPRRAPPPLDDAPVEEPSGPPPAVKADRDDGEPVAVSTRTVRERKDPESRCHAGALGEPPGWPREALAYPFRDRAGFAVAAAAFVAGDAIEGANLVVGVIVKIALILSLLHWQVRAVARSATGDDRPPWFFDPASVDLSELFALLALFAYLFPALIVFVRPYLESPNHPTHTASQTLAIVAMSALALLVAPILLLATALSDRRLMWPWRAILWAARGLVPCVVVGVGWAALFGVERIVAATAPSGVGATVAVSIPLRVVSLALALVGARGIGVLGRRYEL